MARYFNISFKNIKTCSFLFLTEVFGQISWFGFITKPFFFSNCLQRKFTKVSWCHNSTHIANMAHRDEWYQWYLLIKLMILPPINYIINYKTVAISLLTSCFVFCWTLRSATKRTVSTILVFFVLRTTATERWCALQTAHTLFNNVEF